MRPSHKTLAFLTLSLVAFACKPSPPQTGAGAAPASIPGTGTATVTIHLLPSSGNQPFSVKISPALPVFSPRLHPEGLTVALQSAAGAKVRWAKVGVADFRNVATNAPMGKPNSSCEDLSNAVPCQVVFAAPAAGESVGVEYSILLYAHEGDREPDLILDPVGIIKG